MSESGVEYSWDGSADYLKEELLGFMAVNDLAESSFASMTVQLQIFGLIGMASADAIIDMARNKLLYQPTKKKEMSDKKKSWFHFFQRSCTSLLLYVQYRKLQIKDSQTPMLWKDIVIPNKIGISW